MSSMCRYLVLSCPDLFNCANKAGEGSRRWVSGEWWRQASRHVAGHVSASPGDTAHVCRTMGWGRGTKYPWTHIHRYTLSAWKITKADTNYNGCLLPVFFCLKIQMITQTFSSLFVSLLQQSTMIIKVPTLIHSKTKHSKRFLPKSRGVHYF